MKNKKKPKTQERVSQIKLKFKDHKSCLEAILPGNEINDLEKQNSIWRV